MSLLQFGEWPDEKKKGFIPYGACGGAKWNPPLQQEDPALADIGSYIRGIRWYPIP